MSKTDHSRKEMGLQLSRCIEDNDLGQIETLLKENVDLGVEVRGDCPIHLAARKGLTGAIRHLLNYGDNANRLNQSRNTPLHYAAREGHMETLQFLVEKKAKLNVPNKDGDTPLHFAVSTLAMEDIERLVSLGMAVRTQNKAGKTPLHAAVELSRIDAIEALLISKADPNIKDKNGKKAVDLAKDKQTAKEMKVYTDLIAAKQSGNIAAMGINVDPKALELMLKRVDVSITDITSKNLLPYKLYCRREKTENSQIKFLTEEGDDVISDIFHFRVTDCVDVIEFVARIPLYSEIDVKEKPLVKFADGVCQELGETHMENGVTHCDIRISLRTGDTTVFAVYTIPRQEESTVNNSASTVQSKMDKEFQLNVPEGSFKGETTIALKVFEVDDVQGPERKKFKTEDTSMSLLTDVYQINVDGNQPAKDIMVHFPAKNTLSEDDDVIVVTADENSLVDETSLEVVPAKPKLVNNSFVFTVSHFCVYVAVPKSLYNENPSEVLKQIKGAQRRKKSAVLFVMVLEQSSQQHLAVVEVTTANMVQKRTDHWLSKGYKSQEVSKSDSFMMEPCREFEIKFGGNVTPSSNDSDRRLAFLPRRASFQSFRVAVKDVDLSPVGNSTIMTVETDEEGRNSTSCLTVLPFKLPLPPKALVLNKKGTFDVANSEFKGPLLEYLKARFIEYPWIEKSDKPLETKVISLLEQFKVTKPTNLLIKNIEQYAMNTLSEWKNQVYLNLLHNEGDTDTAALTLNDLCRHVFAGLLPTTADDRIDQAYMKFTIFMRCCAHQLDAFMISTHGNSRSSKTSLPVVFNPFWRDFQLFFDSNVNDKQEKGSIKTMEEIEIRRIERYTKI